MDPTIVAAIEQIEQAERFTQERAIDEQKARECTYRAGRHYSLHPYVIKAVMQTENGKVGTLRRNSNGSYDLGPMQLNTINLPILKKEFPGLTWRRLAFDLCANIFAGTYFLKEKINEADDFWTGVGNYHSKTPRWHNRYMKLLLPRYERIVRKSQKEKQNLAYSEQTD